MVFLYCMAVACVLAGLAAAILRVKHLEKARFIAKMIAAMLFLAIAFIAAVMREQAMNLQTSLMLGALVLGAVGDIVLGLDVFVKDNYKRFAFLLGGIPFFLGHILYVILLLSYGNIQWHLVAVLPIVPMFFLILQRFKLVNLGKLIVPLGLYGLVLGGMMLATFNLAAQGGQLGHWMWYPGVLFTISDASLFLNSFGKGKLRELRPVFAFTVMLPYFAAQAIFALTVLWL